MGYFGSIDDYLDQAKAFAQGLLSDDSESGWLVTNDMIPPGAYRTAVLGFAVEQDVDVLMQAASKCGFRLLRLVPTAGDQPGKFYYVGMLTADVKPRKLGVLTTCLSAWAIVAQKDPVGFTEQQALEALWVTQGVKPEVHADVAIPVKEIVFGAVTVLVVGALLYATVRGRD